jgi:hypothetical protein
MVIADIVDYGRTQIISTKQTKDVKTIFGVQLFIDTRIQKQHNGMNNEPEGIIIEIAKIAEGESLPSRKLST